MSSIAASIVAASLALAAFWPRRLPAIEPNVLREYIMDRITRLVLVDTYLVMLDEARGLLGNKYRRLKLAMVSLGLAALIAAVRRDREVSVSDKPKRPMPTVRPDVPQPPPPKPDAALITYIERGRAKGNEKARG